MQEYTRGARLHSRVGLSRSWFMVVGVYFMVLLLWQQLTNLTALFSQCCSSHSSSGTCVVLSHVSKIFFFWCSWHLIAAPASVSSVAAPSDSSARAACDVMPLCGETALTQTAHSQRFHFFGLLIIPERVAWVSLYITAWVSLRTTPMNFLFLSNGLHSVCVCVTLFEQARATVSTPH